MNASALIRPAWTPATIALMVIGFMVFWPLGLAMLAYIIWGDRLDGFKRDVNRATDGVFAGCRRGADKAHRWGHGGGRTGNVAFDDWREKELERLVSLRGLPGTRLVVVGDGPGRADAQRLLPDAVFLGRREGDDLARAYAALDVFVHTGTRETFGQTLQEAAATALPVVAPARGGPLDLVEHGVSGLLFDPDDPRDLAAQVRTLTVRPDAWEQRALLGETARRRVSGCSWSRLVERLVGHYRAACSGKGLATRLS